MSTQDKIKEIRRILHSPISKVLDKGYWFTRLVNSKTISDIDQLYNDIVSDYEFIGDRIMNH